MSVKVMMPAPKKEHNADTDMSQAAEDIILKLIKSVCFTQATSSSTPPYLLSRGQHLVSKALPRQRHRTL